MEPPRSIPGGGPPAFNQTECGAPIAERLAAITARSSPLGLDMADNSQQGEVIDDLKAAAGNEQGPKTACSAMASRPRRRSCVLATGVINPNARSAMRPSTARLVKPQGCG